MTDPHRRHITILIDRSGSMVSIRQATQEGLTAFLTTQAEEDIETLVTLYQFDDGPFEVVYENVPISEVPGYRLQPRNGTALLDSLAEMLTRSRARRKATPKDERPGIEHYLIVTDGEENSSVIYRGKYPEVAKLIEKESKRKGRVFQYMGANQDAIATASKLGIHADHAISYSANQVGTLSVWDSASASASVGLAGGDYAYTPQMRSKAMGEEPQLVVKHPTPFPPASGKGTSLLDPEAVAQRAGEIRKDLRLDEDKDLLDEE